MTDERTDVERRLAAVLHTRADAVAPGDEDAALETVRQRLADARAATRGRRALVVLAAAAAVAVVAGAIVLVRDRKPDRVNVGPPVSTASTTTTSAPPATPVPAPQLPAVWPLPGEPLPSSGEDAVVGFAHEYLGMPGAELVGSVHDGFRIRPFPGAGPLTDVLVAPRNGGYVVTGAASDEVSVAMPTSFDGLDHPLTVAGRSTAFEGTIVLELRPFGSLEPVVQQPAMGGSNGEFGPYRATLETPDSMSSGVLVVYAPDASDRAKMLAASVVPLGPVPNGASAAPQQICAATDHATFVTIDGATGQHHEIGVAASGVATPVDFNGVIGTFAYGDRDGGTSPCDRSISLRSSCIPRHQRCHSTPTKAVTISYGST